MQPLLIVSLMFLSAILVQSCKQYDMLTFDVPAGEANKSLKQFALQAGLDILINESDLSGIKTNSVEGEMTTDAALKIMLEGTGLDYHQEKGSQAIAVYYINENKSK